MANGGVVETLRKKLSIVEGHRGFFRRWERLARAVEQKDVEGIPRCRNSLGQYSLLLDSATPPRRGDSRYRNVFPPRHANGLESAAREDMNVVGPGRNSFLDEEIGAVWRLREIRIVISRGDEYRQRRNRAKCINQEMNRVEICGFVVEQVARDKNQVAASFPSKGACLCDKLPDFSLPLLPLLFRERELRVPETRIEMNV